MQRNGANPRPPPKKKNCIVVRPGWSSPPETRAEEEGPEGPATTAPRARASGSSQSGQVRRAGSGSHTPSPVSGGRNWVGHSGPPLPPPIIAAALTTSVLPSSAMVGPSLCPVPPPVAGVGAVGRRCSPAESSLADLSAAVVSTGRAHQLPFQLTSYQSRCPRWPFPRFLFGQLRHHGRALLLVCAHSRASDHL